MTETSNTNPREPSMSWSMKADSGGNPDSPGRQSVNDFSNRASSQAANVSRGDSLAYSEDSQDHRTPLNLKGLSVPSRPSERPTGPAKRSGEEVNKPSCQNKRPINDSMMSDDSIREGNKAACCVLQ